jgi:hypothetical protein
MSRKAQHLYEPGSTGRAMGPETARPGRSEIAALAYELWKARGCPDGSSAADWLRAEKELKENRGSAKSMAA